MTLANGTHGGAAAALTLASYTNFKATGYAEAGDKMDLVDAPNSTAVTAIQSGLSTVTVAQVNAQADAAIVTYGLDHLAGAAAGADDIVDNSAIAQLAATDGDWSKFAKATDSLQAVRDRGDAEWITATGFITAGQGAVTDTITVTKDDVAHAGVDVWVTTDEAGATMVAGPLVSDVSGVVTFSLDITEGLWAHAQLTGVNFTDYPAEFDVEAGGFTWV